MRIILYTLMCIFLSGCFGGGPSKWRCTFLHVDGEYAVSLSELRRTRPIIIVTNSDGYREHAFSRRQIKECRSEGWQ